MQRQPGLNIHVYPTDMRFQSRVFRISDYLHERGFFSQVELAGMLSGTLPAVEGRPNGVVIRRFAASERLRNSSKFGRAIAFLQWYAHICRYYLFRRIACVNAHSSSVLPLCWFLSVVQNCTLIYEPHELESESGRKAHGYLKAAIRLCERLFIPRAARVIAVNRGIAEWYEKTYGLKKVWTIRNLPEFSLKRTLARDYYAGKFGFPAGDLVFLYQGVITSGRGIDLLLNAFREIGEHYHIVFLGFGDATGIVEKEAARHANIHYHPPVPSGTLVEYSAVADIGVLLYENTSLNNYYSYSNKYCDYLSAGTPVLFSDFLWLRGEAERYDCGWAAPLSPGPLRELIRGIDRAAIAQKSASARRWSEENTWATERCVLDGIYDGLWTVSARMSP